MENYEKYRWFITSSGKLVVGGKSAAQNESLLKELKSSKDDRIVMHTSSPGSPFSVILEDIKSVKKSDIEQTAIFTASFSRAWREGKSKAPVDVFKLSDLYKLKSMKEGTWGVKNKIKTLSAPLQLVLTMQKSKLRAVPEKAVKSKKLILLRITQGKEDKISLLKRLQEFLPKSLAKEEILSALPTGGIKIK